MSRNPVSAGMTVWLTGLPSSGKTTIAKSAASVLLGQDFRVEILDGDELRKDFTSDLGFTHADREENVRRVGFVAELLARHDVVVLVSVIAPYAAGREAIRERHHASGTRFREVFVDAPLSVCRERDVKGLYGHHAAGQIRGLTGVDDPYDPPEKPDLRLLSAQHPILDCTDTLVSNIATWLGCTYPS